MSDLAWCQQACTKLTSCGVGYDDTCPTSCLMAPAFLACVQRSAQECNALALCAFEEASTTYCGNRTTAYPSGRGTCAEAATCQAMCDATNQPRSCACICWKVLAPAKALNLLISNECADTRCKVECGPMGTGPRCLACFTQKCPAENGQCKAS
jgi:hypothetical protein